MRHRTFSSLNVRNYRWYFSGQSLSMIGTWMQTTTQSWLVFKLTGSGTALGVVVALQTLPILLFGPIGGTIADRFGKYRILFYTQGLAGVQAAVLAVLDLTGHLQLWEVYVMAAILGFVNMVDNPTRQTFIVEMVGRDELSNAVTLNSVMVNVARAIGPAVAGVLIAVVGTGWCFALNAASFVFVLAGLKMIDQRLLTPAPPAARGRGQILEGFRYVSRTPVLRNSLLMMAVVGMLAYEFQVSLPLVAKNTLGGGSALYGFLNSAMGIGAVVGGLISAGRTNHSARRLANTALCFGGVMLLAALAPDAATELVALLFVGAASVTFLSLGNSTLQLAAEPGMRGRVMSLWSVAFQGSTPIGGPLVGFIGGTLGARYSLGIGALAAAAAGVFGYATLTGHRPPGAGRGQPSDEVPGLAADVDAAPLAAAGTLQPVDAGAGGPGSVRRGADPGSSRSNGAQRRQAVARSHRSPA
jgi:MFS family permease